MEKQHVCELCNSSFLRKSNLTRHLNKKRKCNVIEFKCISCSKLFLRNSNLTRHINICSVKRINDELHQQKIEAEKQEKIEAEKQQKIEEERQQKIQAEKDTITARLKELEEKYKLLEATIVKQSIPNTEINGKHNITKHGCEDMSHVTLKKLTFILEKGSRCVVECVKLKHFSPLAPENRNVRITNWNNKYACIFSGSNWVIVSRNELIDEIYEDACTYIADNLEEYRDSFSKQTVLKIQKFLDEKDDEDKMNKIKEDICVLIYNERKHPMYNCRDN